MSEQSRESPISQEEKKWIVQTTAIVREIMKEEPRSKKKRSEFLKHPLFLLFAGTLASGVIVNEYQGRQARFADRIKAREVLLMEISSVTGKLMSRAEEVLGLHLTPIKDEIQIINTNKAFNEASDLYTSSLLKIEYSLRILFKKEAMINGWGEIKTGFEEFSKSLGLLHEFKTTEISQEHSKRIALCKDEVKKLTAKLKQYSLALVVNLD
jgi:hypothetical protein